MHKPHLCDICPKLDTTHIGHTKVEGGKYRIFDPYIL